MSQVTFIAGKNGKPSVYHVINANLTNNERNWHYVPPDVIC